MFIPGVIIEIKTLFLETLSTDIANIAIILLISQKRISILSERSEGIEHESTDDVSEKHFEEGEIDDIVDETQDFERLHSLAN